MSTLYSSSRPELFITESTFGENNYSVNVQVLEGSLIKEKIPGFFYKIVFTVKLPSTIIAKNDSATLVLSYNMQYNVTVFGTVNVCGYEGESTTLNLSYGKNYNYKLRLFVQELIAANYTRFIYYCTLYKYTHTSWVNAHR
jgi:hypothetical protein